MAKGLEDPRMPSWTPPRRADATALTDASDACVSATLASLTAIANTPAPWWQPHLPVIREVLAANRAGSVLSALNAVALERNPAIRFVEHAELPRDEPYESFIFRTGCVPTRDDHHDVFNALLWLSYPQTKRRLNALQAHEIEQHGVSGPRGAIRDALTLFDENAAILHASAELIDALRQRDWHSLFVGRRERWRAARLVLFGHALLEKLLQPRKAIAAHVWVVDDIADEAIAASLTHERLVAKPFLPLPVLGIPGWWAANEACGFYADATIFRPLAKVTQR